jgi:hypothetical protein
MRQDVSEAGDGGGGMKHSVCGEVMCSELGAWHKYSAFSLPNRMVQYLFYFQPFHATQEISRLVALYYLLI